KGKGDHEGKNLAGTLIDIPIFVWKFSIILGFSITDNMDIISGVVLGPCCKEIDDMIRLCQIRKIPRSPTRQCPVHLRMGQTLVHPGGDGPPIWPEDLYAYIMAAYQVPPSLDYIPGPEEPQSPPLLDFVPEPMYPEYILQEDEVLPAEEQPLPAAASPTADSPGYVLEDDDDEEEEEHPAPADSVPPVHRMTARISIRDEPSISLPPREEVERLLALTIPLGITLTPLIIFPYHIYHLPHFQHHHLLVLFAPRLQLPHLKELGLTLGPSYEIGESSSCSSTKITRLEVVGRLWRFVGTMGLPRLDQQRGRGCSTLGLECLVQEQDTQDIYAVIGDTQVAKDPDISEESRSCDLHEITQQGRTTRGQVPLTKALKIAEMDYNRLRLGEFQSSMDPAKGPDTA
ncbi:hypothetical protein Tco_0051828, partial [Tanacetum coccineum]